MSEKRQSTANSGLSREAILKAFQEMSDALGRRGATGELCLFGGSVMVLAFAAVKAQYLVEGLFAEGKV